MEPDQIRDTILQTIEASLDAQLRAVRRLRAEGSSGPAKAKASPRGTATKMGRSQVDMAYDILKQATGPLHVSEIITRIAARFHFQVDRESLVSALTKRVVRGDRFQRTDKNTFTLLSSK